VTPHPAAGGGAAGDLLLLCATPGEAGPLAAGVPAPDAPAPDGSLSVPHRLIFTGIGPVNTAHALTRAVEAARPALVLQFGIAGAYVPAALPVGALALATEEVYGDLGVLTPQGWQPADLIGIPVVPPATPQAPPTFNRFPLDPALVARALAVLQTLPLQVRAGPFLTLSQVTGVRALGDALHRRGGALCESMEGAAAAHVCALYRLPFLEVRGISNLVEDRDRERWRIATAAGAARQAVRALAEAFAPMSIFSQTSPSKTVGR
jgi:futalosine hydrolase